MCGIAGTLTFGGRRAPTSESVIRAMTAAIDHRGPDDDGIYLSPPVALGHRRLSIIDLSTGRQPLSNEDGTVWVVYNGEVYNYRELTTWLKAKGHVFRTTSDTEVIVHLYEELGEECVRRLQGMFSFALWDSRQQKLVLARDRVGIKPLYYSRTQDLLLFGSEIKALLAHGSLHAEAEPEILDRFLTYLYVPGERTLFRNVYKVPPGHYLSANADGEVRVTQYWDLNFPRERYSKGFAHCASDLAELLKETVRNHMLSDVPVGVLLSGGIDSTAILSFAAETAGSPISTFTIGFDADQCRDERPYARLAAERFGTRHFEMTISPSEFLQALPDYIWHMEEPVCEPPGIALYFISRLARDHVKVLLSGEGGDEAFAGYQNYRNLVWLENCKQFLGGMSRPIGSLLTGLPMVPGLRRVHKYAALLDVPFDQYYYTRASTPLALFNRCRNELCTEDFRASVPRNGGSSLIEPYLTAINGATTLDRMLYVDTKTWLPDDLLVKADKMTMANSVELRVPLLDHRILEFAAALPGSYKLKGWSTKRILKAAVRERIPRPILNRPKAGFPVPYQSWIRNEFRDFVWDILTDQRTIERGYFRRQAIEALLKRNSEQGDYSEEIFSLVVLELWHRTFAEQTQIALI